MKEPQLITLAELETLKDNTQFMYNSRTGQIAVRDWGIIFPKESLVSDWHCLTKISYPVFKDGKCVGDNLDYMFGVEGKK